MENCAPSVVKQLSKEVKELVQQPPEGIRVAFDDANITDVEASIDGPAETPYAGGRFQVKLVMGHNYPREPPKGFFLTKIFHPNIAPSNGEICVNTLKRDWRPDTGLKHLLLVIKCLLIVPNPESALNEEAGRLLLEEYSEYWRRAKLFTEIHAAAKTDAAAAALPATGSGAVLKDANENAGGDASKRSESVGEKKSAAAAAAAASGAGAKKTKKALKRL